MSIPAHHSRTSLSSSCQQQPSLLNFWSGGNFWRSSPWIARPVLRFDPTSCSCCELLASKPPIPFDLTRFPSPLLPSSMDARITTTGGGGTCAAGEFVWDVVLWRRGRADVSACLLAATASSWLLFYGCGGRGYTALSLASDVLLLLLTVLFLWSKAARLLNRPAPPVPEMRVPQHAVDEAAAALRAALDAVLSGFHGVATGRDSVLFCRVFLCLWAVSIVGSLADFPTFCYASIVAALTLPALYQRYQECVDTYMRFAYLNLRMYEMVYERFSMKCFVRVREWVMEILKDP